MDKKIKAPKLTYREVDFTLGREEDENYQYRVVFDDFSQAHGRVRVTIYEEDLADRTSERLYREYFNRSEVGLNYTHALRLLKDYLTN